MKAPKDGRRAASASVLNQMGETAKAIEDYISYSILSDVDALVTWDQGDLAREHTRRIVQAFGRRERLPVPLIGTPEEVAGWLGLRI